MSDYKEQFCPACGHYKDSTGFERSKTSYMHICEDCAYEQHQQAVDKQEDNDK